MLRLFAALCLFASLTGSAHAMDVALTFEDAPGPETPLLGGERTKLLIASLRDAGVEQAMFFATGKFIETNGAKRLKQYAAAGHSIGSQGYSQRTVDELGAMAFVQDMKQNDLLVKDLPGFKLWFRFPSLNQGSTTAARDTVREWVYHMLYGRSNPTVDVPDAALNAVVQGGVAAGRVVDEANLRRLYVEVMLACIDHYDALARQVLGSSPVHTVRLRENDLSALFVGDLVRALRARGDRIVSATVALNDEWNQYEANVVPLNGSQILAVARERGNHEARPAPIEDPAALRLAIDAAAIWK